MKTSFKSNMHSVISGCYQVANTVSCTIDYLSRTDINTVESFVSGTSQTCCSKSGICRKYKSTVNKPPRIFPQFEYFWKGKT